MEIHLGFVLYHLQTIVFTLDIIYTICISTHTPSIKKVLNNNLIYPIYSIVIYSSMMCSVYNVYYIVYKYSVNRCECG
jgi:hypothetical protein